MVRPLVGTDWTPPPSGGVGWKKGRVVLGMDPPPCHVDYGWVGTEFLIGLVPVKIKTATHRLEAPTAMLVDAWATGPLWTQRFHVASISVPSCDQIDSL